MMRTMDADQPDPEPTTPDPITERLDPDGLKDAHGRTGRLLKAAGLPFEEDEFDASDADETSTSSEDSADDSSDSSSDASS
jgi:hypothetical protein